MIDSAFWEYGGCEEFYDLYHPLTPYGQKLKRRRMFYSEQAKLEREYDLVTLFLNFYQQSPQQAQIEQLRCFLARIVELPSSLEHGELDVTDLFLVKRFLRNIEGLLRVAKEEIEGYFGKVQFPTALLAELSIGQHDGEGFYLADLYDQQLATIRRGIAELQRGEEQLLQEQYEQIKTGTGFDFTHAAFLIISHCERQSLGANTLITFDHYDADHSLVKPTVSRELMDLRSSQWHLKGEEAARESLIVAKLSHFVRDSVHDLRVLEDLVAQIDSGVSRALLAHEYGLTRPCISDHLKIAEGRYLPLVMECEKAGAEYVPLDFELSHKGALLYGSNMGGKSIVLKTVAFMQAFAQCGFFVPAHLFTTCLYEYLCFTGSNEKHPHPGLSSFGGEIVDLIARLQSMRGRASFMIVDEFAASTNAHEAIALNKALLAAFYGKPQLDYIIATHFIENDARLPAISFLKMAGIDHEKLAVQMEKIAATESVAMKVRLLGECMIYKVETHSSVAMDEEALLIAKTLGLDTDILNLAQNFLRRE